MRTRVGYSGGKKKNPSYQSLGDHSEAIRIDYDPARISYGQLLEIFWGDHDPSSPSWSCQYRAAVFYHDGEQKRLALASREGEAAKRKAREIHTAVEPLEVFYPAEDYHQKRYLQNTPELIREFRAMYPEKEGWIRSTAAARVNGYLGGHGSAAHLQAGLNGLGLSPGGMYWLKRLARLRG